MGIRGGGEAGAAAMAQQRPRGGRGGAAWYVLGRKHALPPGRRWQGPGHTVRMGTWGDWAGPATGIGRWAGRCAWPLGRRAWPQALVGRPAGCTRERHHSYPSPSHSTSPRLPCWLACDARQAAGMSAAPNPAGAPAHSSAPAALPVIDISALTSLATCDTPEAAAAADAIRAACEKPALGFFYVKNHGVSRVSAAMRG